MDDSESFYFTIFYSTTSFQKMISYFQNLKAVGPCRRIVVKNMKKQEKH